MPKSGRKGAWPGNMRSVAPLGKAGQMPKSGQTGAWPGNERSVTEYLSEETPVGKPGKMTKSKQGSAIPARCRHLAREMPGLEMGHVFDFVRDVRNGMHVICRVAGSAQGERSQKHCKFVVPSHIFREAAISLDVFWTFPGTSATE